MQPMQPMQMIQLIFLLTTASTTAASATELGRVTRPSEVGVGSLLVEGTEGLRAAPNVSTDVAVDVTGLIARTRVVQRFYNPTPDWVEGVYVFPLPEDAAVDSLQMRIGERRLEGQIQQRAKARATYTKAKRQGRKATLVTQERPNIFTTSVANLGPGEELEIALTYQEDVPYDQGRFSLRFPMVVGPRYIPGTHASQGFTGTGWAVNTDAVPDAARITPPVVGSDTTRSNPVSIAVHLDTGFALADIGSPSHPVLVDARPGNVYEIVLDGGSVSADSDFVLGWSPIVGQAPSAALFHEQWGGDHYALLMVVPPRPEAAARVRLSRETIFVIDTSGSMGGESITQARKALDHALARLHPEDSFNIVRFDSTFSRLYPESRSADADTISDARAWVRNLEANGGTQLLPALEAALEQGAERRAVRQIIFITDGAVGNESALFGAIHDRLGKSRLYTIGIGSAPNSHFMTKAAEFGRGTFTYIASPAQVEEKMNELFAKLDSPVLHDLEMSWDVLGVEAWPERIPDVYLGEPVVVAVRMPEWTGGVVLEGRRGAERVRIDLPMTGGSKHSGIARLWARRKVEALLDSLQGGAELDRVSEQVTTLGIRHHMVTRWTSLVAVDVTPSAPIDLRPETRAVPSLLPKGWTLWGLFGGGPREDETLHQRPSPLQPTSELRTAMKLSTSQPNAFAMPGRLPQGATPAALLICLGSLLFGSSALVWQCGRRS